VAVLADAFLVPGLPAADLDWGMLVAGAREVKAEPGRLQGELGAPAVAASRAGLAPHHNSP